MSSHEAELAIAAAFPDDGTLSVIGEGTNPARRDAKIYGSTRCAYRLDTLRESTAEVELQIHKMPAKLVALLVSTIIAVSALPAKAFFQFVTSDVLVKGRSFSKFTSFMLAKQL